MNVSVKREAVKPRVQAKEPSHVALENEQQPAKRSRG